MFERLKSKIPHHASVLFSSFAYIVIAILLPKGNELVIGFLLLVFLTSMFYHSYPHNIYFRLGDWIAALSFMYYILNTAFQNGLFSILNLWILFSLIGISIISWIISFFAFIKNHNRAYNISHTTWHICSSLLIYYIILSLYI